MKKYAENGNNRATRRWHTVCIIYKMQGSGCCQDDAGTAVRM